MGKINFNFDDFEEERKDGALVPTNSTETLQPLPYDIIPASRSVDNVSLGQLASAASPATAIVSIIDTALGAISDISKCITVVSVEKQRTKQMQAQASAQIEESRQQTNRIIVQQREETKRYITQCKKELDEKRIEFEKMRVELKYQSNSMLDDHQRFLSQLDEISIGINSILRDKEIIHKLLAGTDLDAQRLSILLENLNNVNGRLIESLDKIVALRQG